MGSGESRTTTQALARQGSQGLLQRCPLVLAATVLTSALAGYAVGSWWPPAANPVTTAVLVLLFVAANVALALRCRTAAVHARLRRHALESRLEHGEGAVAQRVADLEALKADLIAVVSHEFRTPLTSLTGYARTLAARMDEMPPSAVHRCVSGIDHHATRLARLVHNVLAAEGDVAVDPQAVTDLGVIVRHAVEEALGIHDHRVMVRHEVPPVLRARIDLLSAHRVIGNLLDNAVKFAPPDSVVEVRASAAGTAVVVEIANGLEPGTDVDVAKLFEPFVQADSSDTRRGEGLGLGLHVARRLTVAHGGELRACRTDGGIVLRLVLPAGAARCRLEAAPVGGEPTAAVQRS